MDITKYNSEAWDRAVAKSDKWTVPVSPEKIVAARRGEVDVVLTPKRPVPADWLGDLRGKDVLGLASAGGQQCPLFAAAGARVTVIDASAGQLGQDRAVAEREGLELRTELGEMQDLSRFADQSFDLVFHPVSNCFVEDVLPVWREVYRVLRPGGVLLAGICNPMMFLCDYELLEDKGIATLRHSVPYSDVTSLTDEERRRWTDAGEPLEFGHSLEDQIGGQLAAGLVLTGFFEDTSDPPDTLAKHLPVFIATRAIRPR